VDLGSFSIKINDKAPLEKLEETQKWMRDFVRIEVESLNYAYNLVKPELWENYKLYGLDNLPECKLLKSAKRAFKATWKKRPGLLRKTKEDITPVNKCYAEIEKLVDATPLDWGIVSEDHWDCFMQAVSKSNVTVSQILEVKCLGVQITDFVSQYVKISPIYKTIWDTEEEELS
jgi:hypothetical protein